VVRVYVGIGSNIEPVDNLRLAIRELRRRFGDLDISPVYRNRAVGFSGDDFLNLVAGFDTDMTVEEICAEIDAIHASAGRVRGAERFDSRSLDIDLLLYGQTVRAGPPVRVPRPDVLEYSFVLKPLVDIAPDTVHPETGRTLAEHWQAVDQDSHPMEKVESSLD
jgi:2-amino-4-hydroxy-6-hydroxymethyldihydropteridine diphosphokinase